MRDPEKGRALSFIGKINVRAAFYQQAGNREVAALRGPKKRGPASVVGGVYIDATKEKTLHGFGITEHRGVTQAFFEDHRIRGRNCHRI